MKNVFMFLLCLLISGCMSFQKVEPLKIQKYEKQYMTEYVYDWSKDESPQKINIIYVDENFNITNDKDKQKYIVFTNDEFKKILQLQKIAKYYKDQVGEHEKLVNQKIVIINLQKDEAELMSKQIEKFNELWANSENSYIKEKQLHTIDNWINRTLISIISVSTIIVAISAL